MRADDSQLNAPTEEKLRWRIPVKRVYELPFSFSDKTKDLVIDRFPDDLYNPDIKIYPKRVAVINLTRDLKVP